MSDIMDDLLEEVEQLEKSTQEIESANQATTTQKQKIQEVTEEVNSNANLLALETSKTAQEAAVQSHQAAQTAIKQAESLKEQVLELSESNFNWRQVVRNANKEIQSSKGTFTVMLTTSIVFSFIAIGAMGYLFYNMQKQEAQFKGEVLDMISTENALLNKKITLKMDELASVIEIMTERVAQQAATNAQSVNTGQTESQKPETDTTASVTTERTADVKAETESTSPSHNEEVKTAEHKQQVVQLAQTEEIPEKIAAAEQNKLNATIVAQNEVVAKEYAELKQLVEQMLTEQKAIQAQVQANAKQPVAATSGLNSEQLKKLNDISWLIRKQAKTLQSIQAKVGLKANNTVMQSKNSEILNELKHLKLQQGALQSQLQEMQTALKKFTEQPKEPAPYSYKAK